MTARTVGIPTLRPAFCDLAGELMMGQMGTLPRAALALALVASSADAFTLPPPRAPAPLLARAAAPLRAPPAPARADVPVQMGLFGLGTPELVVIAGVALVILGPDKVKDLAKEVGKASAELKQVPEEFAKGMEAGAEESVAKMPPAEETTKE